MKANFYVDGFNFYYGCVKDTPYRWLDLSALFQLIFPNDHVNRIRYFTARVKPRPNDPSQPQRQQTYIRALETIPNLSVHFGYFLDTTVRMRLANPPESGSQTAEVIKTEEKGSDVNLATFLLVDAFNKDCDMSVIVSNDSDLKTPIEFLRTQLGIKVGILNPQTNRSWALYNAVDFYYAIRQGTLRASQFPPQLSDSRGIINKPQSW